VARELAAYSVETTRQAVRGVLGAALAQTLVATFAFAVAGIPGWVIWAGITFILSLVQVGPMVVTLPMAGWLWMSDRPGMAIFMALWSLIVVNITDNVIRPMLLSKDGNLPATLAFLGALGGLVEWGVVGVFLGPVILAVGYKLFLKWIATGRDGAATSFSLTPITGLQPIAAPRPGSPKK
jgi:predicted PurR-regulated permease PerM